MLAAGRTLRLGAALRSLVAATSAAVTPAAAVAAAAPQLFQGEHGALNFTAAKGLPSSPAAFAGQLRQFSEDAKMFCFQCEQTSKGTGCTEQGVCGKTPEVAALQDLLMYSLKGLSTYAELARANGITDDEVDSFTLEATFSTLTNVNFDDTRFTEYLKHCSALMDRLDSALRHKGVKLAVPDAQWMTSSNMPHPAQWRTGLNMTESVGELIETGKAVGIMQKQEAVGNATLVGVQELLTYGLKGLAAYAHHAEALGKKDASVYAYVQEALAFLAKPESLDLNEVLRMTFKCGEVNLLVMQMLSEGHTDRYGHPVPTQVNLNPLPGKCILVTGHDIHDLEELLKQTEGKGLHIYTHGELLPAHGYPLLKSKYPHLVAHFGGAWYKQKKDFADFPGAILVTTNCVLDPLEAYRHNIFTTGATGVTGVRHIAGKDFSAVIDRALQLPGFSEERAASIPAKQVTVGFGHKAVLGVAGQVIEAMQQKKLEHIFLIGGCDGSEPQRKYYGNLAKRMPTNTMVLTLGCGKFRIFDQEFGTLPGTGLPRLLDMGQCNDSYSALVVAQELAKALNCGVNDLPLSLDLSWFEQKAVAVLLTLLHLGVRNIRIGPKLPAFLTPDAVNLLVEKFALTPADMKNPEKDLERMMMRATA